MRGDVVAVSRAAEHGFAKRPEPAVEMVAGEGVVGDAHRGVTVQHLYQMRRDPAQPNLCQVHLLAEEKLQELAEAGFALGPGDLGENVLTRGIDLLRLPKSTLLRLGAEVVLEVTGLRTPCSQIDGYRKGLQAQMWGPRDAKGVRERRAGVMSVVRCGGVVRPGDSIVVEMPVGEFVALGPV